MLWGPSGSGKSTLLAAVAGLVTLDGGEIVVQQGTNSACVHQLDEDGCARYRRMWLGYVFQFFNLVPTLTVDENLRLPLQLAGRSVGVAEDRQITGRLLADVGLADRGNAYPAQLSGGEQQRVAVLRALVHQPALVLADEPTGNLDQDNADKVIDLLVSQARSTGSALLLATHSERVAQRADRVIDMQ